jgi:hypothetical protein
MRSTVGVWWGEIHGHTIDPWCPLVPCIQYLKNGKAAGGPRLFQKYSPSVHSRFSPDGKWIAFASRCAWLNDEAPLSNGESQPYGEIFVAPVDGTSEPIRLTHNKWEDSVRCWGVMPPSATSH